MLKINNLSINYGSISALRDENIVVNRGELVTLIGANGAGKTSTLMAISNLISKKAGSVEFKGIDITNMVPNKIVKMGLSHVPEGRKIFPQLSVYENLIAGSLGKDNQTKQQINDLLEQQYELFPRLKERNKQNCKDGIIPCS